MNEQNFRIVPFNADPVDFTGTLEQAKEEARERNADVFDGDECIWENPDAEI